MPDHPSPIDLAKPSRSGRYPARYRRDRLKVVSAIPHVRSTKDISGRLSRLDPPVMPSSRWAAG